MRAKPFILFLLSLNQTYFTQTVEAYEYPPGIKQRIDSIYDGILGNWQLINKITIRTGHKDTVYQQASSKITSRTDTTRPKIILSFKMGGDMVITEYPAGQKIKVQKARWKLDYRSSDTSSMYLEMFNGVDSEFRGNVTKLDKQHFQLRKNSSEEPKQLIEFNFKKI